MKPIQGLVYVSAIDPTIRLFAESVIDGDDGHYLVMIVHDDDKDDMGAIGQELDPDQWADLVEKASLTATA